MRDFKDTIRRTITVGKLKELLGQLPGDHYVVVNRVGNLNVYQTSADGGGGTEEVDWKWVGYIEIGDETYVAVET